MSNTEHIAPLPIAEDSAGGFISVMQSIWRAPQVTAEFDADFGDGEAVILKIGEATLCTDPAIARTIADAIYAVLPRQERVRGVPAQSVESGHDIGVSAAAEMFPQHQRSNTFLVAGPVSIGDTGTTVQA